MKQEISSLYNALKAPVAITKKLKTLQNLELNFHANERELELSEKTKRLSTSLETPRLHNLTELVHVNNITKRFKEAQLAFSKIHENGLKPDLIAYNHLMDSFARQGDLEMAKNVFKEIQEKFTPDLVSYSTLIKACVECDELDAAFKLVQDMKAQGIHPNQIVFTTLIKGCLKNGLVSRAWSTFDHLRTEIQSPDSHTFNLMIYACRKTKDAEKALDLFQEMTDRNVPISSATFNSLILACGTRDDYYEHAFSLLEQMLANEFEPDIHTFRALLEIAATHGDVPRARLLWNDLICRIPDSVEEFDHVSEPFAIDQRILTSMLKCYANALKNYKKGKKFETTTQFSPTADVNGYPCFKQTEITFPKLEEEAEKVWQIVKDEESKGKIMLSSNILNHRLWTLCNGKDRNKALEFFQTAFKQVQPNGETYSLIIQKTSKEQIETSVNIFKDLLKWDEEQEKICSITSEKEKLRTLQCRTKETMRRCFLSIAKGYCKNGDVEKSLKTLDELVVFRYEGYMPQIRFKEVPNILNECQKLADNGNWEPLKRINQLCPQPNDPISKVRKALGEKYTGKHWWGWEAMGVSEAERKKLLWKSSKNKAKAMQYLATKQAKAKIANENRLKKQENK